MMSLPEFIEKIAQDIAPDSKVVTKDLGGVLMIEVVTSTPELLIGRSGDSLQSLQDLGYAYFRRLEPLEYAFFVVEIGGYRKKYLDYYLNLFEEEVRKVIETKQEGGMPPMNSFLRKIIHSIAAKKYAEDIVTESVGDGQNRRILLKAAK